MQEKEIIYDIIIIGGGCAGLTAAIYAGRAKLKTLVIEKQYVGGQASTTDEIANYPGFLSITGPDLMERLHNQAKSFGIEFIYTDVQKISLEDKIKVLKTTSKVIKSHTVIIATGASPKSIGFEGEDEFKGKGVGYCATCDGFFYNNKDIFVIGGGYSAVQEALYLTKFGKKVTIVVRKDKFRCAQSLVDKAMENPKISVLFNTEIIKAYGDKVLKGAIFINNLTNETFEYKVSEQDVNFGIFVFIGLKPETEAFKDIIELSEEGYIITDENMETNIPGIYSAGDVRKKSLRQLVTAAADGAIAATQAEKYILEE